MSDLMSNISERLPFNDSFQKAYGKPLDEIENDWRKSLGITKIYGETDIETDVSGQNNEKLDEITEIKDENTSISPNNSSCNNGGSMGIDIALVCFFTILYFVRKYKFNTEKRNI